RWKGTKLPYAKKHHLIEIVPGTARHVLLILVYLGQLRHRLIPEEDGVVEDHVHKTREVLHVLRLLDDGLVVEGNGPQVAQDHCEEVAEIELVVKLSVACSGETVQRQLDDIARGSRDEAANEGRIK